MWFWLSILALLFWSGSDLFSKLGCRDGSDRYAHLKMVIAVGAVMGLHAAWEIFAGGTVITWQIMLTYLPVSALYILSMTLGYLGLRYIELSISSPICNSSGALVAVLCLITGGIGSVNSWQLFAVTLVCLGVVGLGVVEAREDEDSANAAYELTFLACAVVCFLYVVVIKGDRLVPKAEAPKYIGALCETAG